MFCRIYLSALVPAYVVALALALGAAAAPASAQTLTDPYEILAKHYEAMGGLEALKAERTKYFEATVSVMGLEGTVKQWEESPLKKRQEVDLKIFKQISGDNGEFSWVVDQNGKLQVQKDEITAKKRQVEELLAGYEHLKRDSKYFTVTLEGIEKVADADCYVLRTANSINEDVRRDYINAATFMDDKVIVATPALETHTTLSDVRDVAGIKVPFRHDAEIKPIEQKQTIQITKYESNVPIDPALFEPPGRDAEDFTFAEGASAEDIPFEYIGDHLFIEATVNCDKRLWVLDTGAATTVIDSTYAASIGLEPAGNFKAVGAGKTVGASFVTLPAFSVGTIRFGEQQVVSIGIAELFKRAGLSAAGILGYDFLSRFVTKIDYAARKISFYKPDGFAYAGPGVVVDAPLRDNIFAFPASVAGRYSGIWSLDLGASSTSFFYSYAEKNGIFALRGLEGLAGGAGGYFTMRASKYESAEIAGFMLGEQVISAPLEKSGAFGAREETGNIGNDILRHFVLYLDYSRQQVIFEKGADFDTVFPRGKAGLGLVVADDGGYEVFYVAKGTPAERARFKAGDRVKRINGIPVETFASLIALTELFKAEAGTVYNIEISRDGKSHHMKLRLEELL
jgi:outer membrane lipoprotein-sorting protein